MSGHSKWATIKHKKAAIDAKRGKAFTRIIKEIMIAARNGGDPDGNPRLRTAITAAKAVSMPADNIKRAIMRGTGELEGGQIDEIMFEGYGPGGAAVLVSVATDNRNRTVSEIRHAFSKNGGNLGEQGSVAWMFERKSQIIIDGEKATEDELMDLVLEPAPTICATKAAIGRCFRAPEVHEAVLEAIQKAGIPHGIGGNRHGSEEPDEAGRQERQRHAEAERSAGRARRRAERLFQLRHRREGAGGSGVSATEQVVRVLGIDCGTERTGWGVIESDGRRHTVVAHGVILPARARSSGNAPGGDRRRAALR